MLPTCRLAAVSGRGNQPGIAESMRGASGAVMPNAGFFPGCRVFSLQLPISAQKVGKKLGMR